MKQLVKFINSWVQGIILAVIIGTVIEIILPEGNNKKFIKTIIGVYILFSIIHPLISKISNKTFNFNSIIQSINTSMNGYQNDNKISIEVNKYIEEDYESKLKKDIKEKIFSKGYKVNLLNISIETENENMYGQINSIDIEIEKREENTNKDEEKLNIKQVENIEINTSKNTNEKENYEKNGIQDEDNKTLKEYLSTTYGINEEKIYINE